MEQPLYSFTGNDGTFTSSTADRLRALYFPLGNERLMSSVTPRLHGDAKTDNDHFLLEPVSRIDLVTSRQSRNFWVYFPESKAAWSAAGVPTPHPNESKDFSLKAGLLWHQVSRTHTGTGLKADILSFVPSGDDPVEIMRVTLTNTGAQTCRLVPFAAIPLYCRSAHNLRDHRHVTSLLERVTLKEFGVLVKPTLLFDEAGHHPNTTVYFAAGWDAHSKWPDSIYPTQEIFCQEAGDLEAPESVLRNIPAQKGPINGKEAMAGLRFSEAVLKPDESISYTVVIGIAGTVSAAEELVKRYANTGVTEAALERTKEHWLQVSRQVRVETGDTVFDNWFHWVNIQPTLRRIFGCSFLPDFDYGRGGRGWRDLWQDCLGLILSGPETVARVMVDNFAGVRMDGSNATIIGKKKGEFIADRNRISRVWMDHGVWPLLTLNLYLHETGHSDILFTRAPYFCDPQTHRSRGYNAAWDSSRGTALRTRQGRVYLGTILEHLIVQNLVQFFNVGEHNHVRLEGADWNDGLDMAPQRGESVAFSAMYAYNLNLIAELIEESGKRTIEYAEELSLLLKKCAYDDPRAKQRVLTRYCDAVAAGVTGKKVKGDARAVARDLREKSLWMARHIRDTEWLKQGFFNGYYDNRGRKVEGKHEGRKRMMLASQVFEVMSGVADEHQVKTLWKAAVELLRDPVLKGFHLNTDFGQEQHDFGRAFSFVYGDKENGAYFSHMNVMFAYSLYSRGFVDQGWSVLKSIVDMSLNTPSNRMYPCLPEYFDIDGRGMYSYLTGSASWFILTMITSVYGIRGLKGNLLIEPKMVKEQFTRDSITVTRTFGSRRLKIIYRNPGRLSYNDYRIQKVTIDSEAVRVTSGARYALIKRADILALSPDAQHTIVVELG